MYNALTLSDLADGIHPNATGYGKMAPVWEQGIKALYPMPTVSLTANPQAIKIGSSTVLSWNSTNATSCTGTNFATAGAVSGSQTLSPTATTTYTVNCTGNGGSKSASVTVGVTTNLQPPVAAPTAALSANPTAIKVGSSTTLTWSSTNATSCTGTNFATGNAASGSVSASPTATTTYSVTCTGAGGSKSASVTVGVTPKPSPPQVILTPTSGGSVTDSTGGVWTLTSSGSVIKDGVAVAGGGGTSALTYTSASKKIWGQDAASLQWYYWDGANWIGPSATYQ